MADGSTVALRAILRDEISAALKSIQKEIQQTSDGAGDAGKAIRGAFSEALPTIQGVTDSLGKQVSALRAQRDAMKTPEYQEYGTKMRELQSEIKKMEADLWGEKEASDAQGNSWANLAGKLFIAQQAYQMFAPMMMSVVKAAADYDSVRTRLTATEGSSMISDADMESLQKLAKLPGLGFEQAAQSLASLRSMRVSAQDAFSIIDGIAKANASMGGGAEQFGRVMYQLQQSIGKGKVMAEDMNAIKEAIPNLGALLEDAYGTSDSEKINDRLKKTGESVRSFWMNVADMARKLPPAGDTINNNLDNIGDNWKRFRANLIDSDFLKTVTGRIADFSDSLANTASKSKEFEEATRATAGRGGLLGMLLGDATKAEQELAIINGEMERAGKAAGVGSFSKTSGSEAQSSQAIYLNSLKQKADSDASDAKRKDQLKKDEEEKEKEKREKKEKAEIAASQKEIQQFLASKELKIHADEVYEKTLKDLTEDGVNKQVSIISAGTDKQIAEVQAGYAKMRTAKGVTRADLVRIERDQQAEIENIQAKSAEKIQAIYNKEHNDNVIKNAKDYKSDQEYFQKKQNEVKEASKKIAEINISSSKELPGTVGKKDSSKYGLERQAIDQSAAERKRSIASEIKDEKQKAAALQAIEANSAVQKAKVDRAELEERKKNYEKYSAHVESYAQSQLSSLLQGEFTLTKAKEAAKDAAINFIAEEATKRMAKWVESLVFEKSESAVANAESIAQAQITGAMLAESYATAAAWASIMTMGVADVAGATGMATTLAAAKSASVGGFAGGGVQFGSAYTGERGPEISTPTVPRRITQTTNSTVNNSYGGGTIIINTGASVDRVAAVAVRATTRQARGMVRSSR